jgi:GNAT superfamily N-acetyltransferase
MVTVEKLTPAWREAFLVSRNSLFTPIESPYLEQVENPDSSVPVRTFIGRDQSKVLSWGSFYLRGLHTERDRVPALRVAMACAIGTLPDHQRQGLGTKVWRAAEMALAQEVDGVLVYTGESGPGYSFYRAMGYLPLLYPPCVRRKVSSESGAEKDVAKTRPLAGFVDFWHSGPSVFTECYRGSCGFLADRPGSLERWAKASFFYHANAIGCIPQVSWLQDESSGSWTAYAIWAGPIEKIDWKRGAVEIWELACRDNCSTKSLDQLLRPACQAARKGSGYVDWWAVPGRLTERMLALDFTELPRSLCVLGKVFDPAMNLAEQLEARGFPANCRNGAGGRAEMSAGGCIVEIERDAATRMVFARSSASQEHQLGMLTMRPMAKARATLEAFDAALPRVPWSYLASEYI